MSFMTNRNQRMTVGRGFEPHQRLAMFS